MPSIIVRFHFSSANCITISEHSIAHFNIDNEIDQKVATCIWYLVEARPDRIDLATIHDYRHYNIVLQMDKSPAIKSTVFVHETCADQVPSPVGYTAYVDRGSLKVTEGYLEHAQTKRFRLDGATPSHVFIRRSCLYAELELEDGSLQDRALLVIGGSSISFERVESPTVISEPISDCATDRVVYVNRNSCDANRRFMITGNIRLRNQRKMALAIASGKWPLGSEFTRKEFRQAAADLAALCNYSDEECERHSRIGPSVVPPLVLLAQEAYRLLSDDEPYAALFIRLCRVMIGAV